MNNFGLHVTIDASGCKKEKLASQELVYDLLNELPAKIGMTKMTLPYVCKWLDKFAKGTAGFSGFIMIAESHISIHTFPDQNYVFIDMFSCKNFDSDKITKHILDVFEATDHKINNIERGLDFPKEK